MFTILVFLQYEEATSRCDEYMALYTELKAENAGLLQRLKRRTRGELMSQRGQISVAQELDMTDSCPSSRRHGQMSVAQELDMTDSCLSSRRYGQMSVAQKLDMTDSCLSSRRYGQMSVAQELDIADSCPSSRRCVNWYGL